jgi:spermidine/putrescine transport system ATP-binding protein
LYRRPSSRRVGEFIGMMNFLPATVIGDNAAGVEIDVAGLGRAVLETAQCPGGSHPGVAQVGLRPESLTVLFDGQAGEGRVAQGTVDEVTYYGDMTYYDIRFDGAPSSVAVSMRNMPGRQVLDRGARANLAWDPRAMVLFR